MAADLKVLLEKNMCDGRDKGDLGGLCETASEEI